MLILNHELEKTIRKESEIAYPNECCGVLIGEIGDDPDKNVIKTVRQLEPIVNAREDAAQHNRFLITAEDMLHAEKTARASKLDVLGFYHSHPDHPSAPSEYDKTHALPFYSYIIVSVKQGQSAELTSWELTPARDAFLPEKVSN